MNKEPDNQLNIQKVILALLLLAALLIYLDSHFDFIGIAKWMKPDPGPIVINP